MMREPPPIAVHIAELSLPAMAPARARRVAAAFETELARLLSQPAQLERLQALAAAGALAGLAAVAAPPLARAPSTRAFAAERPERMGHRIAASVAAGLLAPTPPRGRAR